MPFSSTFANDLVKLIFNGTPIANLADNASASPLTALYLRLHTADPGAAGTQATNEISYTGYAGVALTRNSSGWVVTANSASPIANVDFGKMTAGAGGTVTHVTVGTAASGAGKVLVRGAITPTIPVSTGTTPRVEAGSVIPFLTA